MPPEKKKVISTCKHVTYETYNVLYQKHVNFRYVQSKPERTIS